MPFIDKVYWITDVNGKRHLRNVKELVHPTEEELQHEKRLKQNIERIYKANGDGMKRLAESDYKPYPSDYAYWEKQGETDESKQ